MFKTYHKIIILFTACLATVVLCQMSPELKLAEGAGVVMKLPETLEGYDGFKRDPSKVEIDQLPPETKFAKMAYFPKAYISQQDAYDRSVNVSIVLSGVDARSMHRPEICLTGQGWTIISDHIRKVEIAGKTLEVVDLFIERKDSLKGGKTIRTRAHYYYWWVGKDISTPSSFKRIFLTTWDNLWHNKAHRWAYPSVMASYEVTGDLDQDESKDTAAVERIEKIMRQVVPVFQKSFH